MLCVYVNFRVKWYFQPAENAAVRLTDGGILTCSPLQASLGLTLHSRTHHVRSISPWLHGYHLTRETAFCCY